MYGVLLEPSEAGKLALIEVEIRPERSGGRIGTESKEPVFK